MDISDTATVREERDRAIALKARKPAGLEPTGLCLFCGEALDTGLRWCNTDCRDDWEARN